MTPQNTLSQRAIPVRETENTQTKTASRGKRSLLDTTDFSVQGRNVEEHIGVIASTSALVAASSTKRAKRAETRECPVCGDHIPLRLLGQHYTLESSRVQTILDHVGDLECFSDPHSSTHAPYVCHLCTHPSPDTHGHCEAYAYSTTHKDSGAPSRCRPIP